MPKRRAVAAHDREAHGHLRLVGTGLPDKELRHLASDDHRAVAIDGLESRAVEELPHVGPNEHADIIGGRNGVRLVPLPILANRLLVRAHVFESLELNRRLRHLHSAQLQLRGGPPLQGHMLQQCRTRGGTDSYGDKYGEKSNAHSYCSPDHFAQPLLRSAVAMALTDSCNPSTTRASRSPERKRLNSST